MCMRKAAKTWLEAYEAVNGPKGGVTYAVQGCPHHCHHCFNPETWDPNGGTLFTDEDKKEIIDALRKPGIARLTILGGEPLEQRNIKPLTDLLTEIQSDPVLKSKIEWFVLYTGYELSPYDFIRGKDNPLIDLFDKLTMIVDGPFKEDLKRINSVDCVFRGSSNQRLIDVKETIYVNNEEKANPPMILTYSDKYFTDFLYLKH